MRCICCSCATYYLMTHCLSGGSSNCIYPYFLVLLHSCIAPSGCGFEPRQASELSGCQSAAQMATCRSRTPNSLTIPLHNLPLPRMPVYLRRCHCTQSDGIHLPPPLSDARGPKKLSQLRILLLQYIGRKTSRRSVTAYIIHLQYKAPLVYALTTSLKSPFSSQSAPPPQLPSPTSPI